MQSLTRKHPFRDISLLCHNRRPLNSFELDMLEKYKQLLDSTGVYNNFVLDQLEKFSMYAEPLGNCCRLQVELDKEYRSAAKRCHPRNNQGKLNNDPAETAELLRKLNAFNEVFKPLDKQMKSLDYSRLDEFLPFLLDKVNAETRYLEKDFIKPMLDNPEHVEFELGSLKKDWAAYQAARKEIDHLKNTLVKFRVDMEGSYDMIVKEFSKLAVEMHAFLGALLEADGILKRVDRN